MPAITFRFTTECQIAVDGDSYEEAYLRFKDFMHGDAPIATAAGLEVFPPEDPTIYFEVDDQADYSTIEQFKGDFVADILDNSSEEVKARIHHSAVGG